MLKGKVKQLRKHASTKTCSRRSKLAAALAVGIFAVFPGVAASQVAGPTLSVSNQTLNWTAIAGTDKYRVLETTPTGAKINTYLKGVLTYTPAPLAEGETGKFKVKSRTPVASNWSNEVSITYPVKEKEKEPPTGREVTSNPLGPAIPAGGWAVSYGDAFSVALGTGAGQDNTWFPNSGGGTQSSCQTASQDCRGSNGNEIQVFNSSAVSVTPEGLKLNCTYLGTTGVEAVNKLSGEGKKHYRCGAADAPFCCSTSQPERSGYNAPLIHIVNGTYYAFQVRMKLPINTKENDSAFWMNGPPWSGTEFDFPEVTAWGKEGYSAGDIMRWHWFAGFETTFSGPVGAETGVHTYTTELVPAASGKHRTLIWIDGVKKTESGEITDPTAENKLGLILQYAMRECHSGGPCGTEGGNGSDGAGISIGFKTAGEQRTTLIDSVAVYTDKNHANSGIEHPSIAPGTVVK